MKQAQALTKTEKNKQAERRGLYHEQASLLHKSRMLDSQIHRLEDEMRAEGIPMKIIRFCAVEQNQTTA
jgi:hypothetical protein